MAGLPLKIDRALVWFSKTCIGVLESCEIIKNHSYPLFKWGGKIKSYESFIQLFQYNISDSLLKALFQKIPFIFDWLIAIFILNPWFVRFITSILKLINTHCGKNEIS